MYRYLKPRNYYLRVAHEFRRCYKVLAIESSCDDSCVALLDKYLPLEPPKIIEQLKKTLNSSAKGGVVPTDAHEFHQYTVADLVFKLSKKYDLNDSPPDLICCTRGPGMVGSLSSSLQLAKGLALAWDRPLIGVHHMLGHILVSNLPKAQQPDIPPPKFPYLSLLCSGGHTMLVFLKSLTEHEILINTCDIAAGDSLDKCARELGLTGNMLGRELEKLVDNIPQSTLEDFELVNTNNRNNRFKIQLALPFKGPKHPRVPERLEFSFASFLSTIQQHKKQFGEFDNLTKQFIAYKVQNVLFKHMIDRINVCIQKHGLLGDGKLIGVNDIICSGGVASNKRLREMLSTELKYKDLNAESGSNSMVKFHFPDLELCTDNAVMIGVAGIEIYERIKKKSSLNILPIRKWPMDKLLDVDGWIDI